MVWAGNREVRMKRSWARLARMTAAMLTVANLPAPSVPDAAAQQNYPDKAIKLVVPFGPGGPTDVAARVAQDIIQSALGHSVIIENRPGAGGGTGTKAVAMAEPDGYTLLIGTAATFGAVPALSKNPGFDPVTSFAHIAKLADSTTVLVAPIEFPAKTLKDFIVYAKANPGKLNYASAGLGNLTQLNAEVFKSKAGLDIVHVPFKSGAEMVTAILGGQVHMGFIDVSILLPLIQDNKIRALAVTSAARHVAMPDVPVMSEGGLPEFVTTFWSGVMAPAGTSPAIVAKLNATINAGLEKPAIRDLVGKVGATVSPMPQAVYAAFVAGEAGKWKAIVKLAGIAPE
jgi:tripartite-type tricarboxylate transporter receptor subunit TctC